jgi:hypothetical protein
VAALFSSPRCAGRQLKAFGLIGVGTAGVGAVLMGGAD